MSQATPYDESPYFSRPILHADIDRLASVATLFGMRPPPLETARVLELGSAAGGHLIPLASQFPGARFTGVDLSEQQIDHGKERVKALGLENLDLLHMSVTDIDRAFGQFDYVIAHGFYSWVPEAVRAHTLEILRSNLAPQGVGYVSFNTLPGWAFQRTLREMMCFHTRLLSEPGERIAQSRAFLQFLTQETPPGTLYANQLAIEAGELLKTPWYHLLHDHLAEFNQPEYFHEFMAAAAAHDLQYLGDTDLWSMNSARLSAQAREFLQTIPDRVLREQYMDFLLRRSFRRTLLVHADVSLDLNLDMARLEPFHARLEGTVSPSDADPLGEEPFKLSNPNAAVEVTAPLAKAALLVLRACPQGVPCTDLHRLACERLGQTLAQEDEGSMGSFLLSNAMAGTLTLGLRRHSYTLDPGERPTAAPFARLAAEKEDPAVPNLRHRSLALNELERLVLARLDGTRDVAALVEETGVDEASVVETLGSLAVKAMLLEATPAGA